MLRKTEALSEPGEEECYVDFDVSVGRRQICHLVVWKEGRETNILWACNTYQMNIYSSF